CHRALAGGHRQRQDEEIAVDRTMRKDQQPGDADRYDEDVDGEEIERKEPGGAADLRLAGILDDDDVELPRQAEHRGEGEAGYRDPSDAVGAAEEKPREIRSCGKSRAEIGEAAEHAPGDETTDDEEGEKLHQGFEGYRQDHAFVMFGGVDLARAEKDGEERHDQRDGQRRVVPDRLAMRNRLQRGRILRQRDEARRYRFELQRDVGKRADHRDDGDRRAQHLALAVACGDEVGDGGDVVRLGDADDPRQQRPAQREHQDRADIDRQEVVTRPRSKPDAAIEGPGGAVDGARQRVDHRLDACPATAAPGEPGAPPGDDEEEDDISQREGQHAPGADHQPPPSARSGYLRNPRKRARPPRTGSPSRSTAAKRWTRRPIATSASMRASDMPAQAWMPVAKARWRLGWRRRSSRSGSAN